MHVESTIGSYPCLVTGEGPPLVVLAGLTPDVGVAPGPMRRIHEQAMLTVYPRLGHITVTSFAPAIAEVLGFLDAQG